jgi:streptomycin 3"-adenylyltransferase
VPKERNVILTLASIWVTAAAGEFLPKDEAAKWARLRLPKE